MGDPGHQNNPEPESNGKSAPKIAEGTKSKVSTVRHKFEKNTRELTRRSSDPTEARSKATKVNAVDCIQEYGRLVHGGGQQGHHGLCDRRGTSSTRRGKPQHVREYSVKHIGATTSRCWRRSATAIGVRRRIDH